MVFLRTPPLSFVSKLHKEGFSYKLSPSGNQFGHENLHNLNKSSPRQLGNSEHSTCQTIDSEWGSENTSHLAEFHLKTNTRGTWEVLSIRTAFCKASCPPLHGWLTVITAPLFFFKGNAPVKSLVPFYPL